MAFWAIEVVPGKDHVTTPPYDLHVTQAVLPAKAADKGRSVVQCSVSDEGEEEQKSSQFALASLKLDLQENVGLDVIFEADKEVHFSVSGKNAVQLLGYYISDEGSDQFPDFDDDEIDSDEEGLGLGSDDDDELGAEDDEDEDDEEGDEEDDDEDDLDEKVDEDAINAALRQQIQQQQKRKPEQQAQNGGSAKKPKTEGGQQQQQGKKETPQQAKPQQQQQQGGQKTPQQQGGKQQQGGQKTPQQQQGQKTPQQQQGGQKPQTPATGGKQQQGGQQQPKEGTRKVLASGLVVQTITHGTGAKAEVGKKIRVHYTGRLTNGKVFDKSRTPFQFRLGAGDVIQGWDQGVQGMRVGEKRKLTIPSGLGYGRRGAPPDIPPNATLEFDVELVSC